MITRPSLPLRHIHWMDRRPKALHKYLWKKERRRFLEMPRYKSGSALLFDHQFSFCDAHSFIHAVDHIFHKECYAFESSTKSPLIIDAGANVGLSMLYFKRTYPDAEVICFEPDPNCFAHLKENQSSYHLTKCSFHNAALWSEKTTLSFSAEGADAGSVVSDDNQNKTFDVQALKLSDFIKEQTVDLLKIDIEGAELTVLEESAPYLKNVERIFVEYHSYIGQDQNLWRIAKVLEESGFRIHINYAGLKSAHPMKKIKSYLGMDLQLDIYGVRQEPIE